MYVYMYVYIICVWIYIKRNIVNIHIHMCVCRGFSLVDLNLLSTYHSNEKRSNPPFCVTKRERLRYILR